jgi:hypothetical protein
MVGFRYILQKVFVYLLWVYAATKALLDWMGRASLFEDADHSRSMINHGLEWIFSTPWWAPICLAGAATLLLFWPNIRGHFSSPAVGLVQKDGVSSGNISAIQLVPSDQVMSLVVTPRRGGTIVSIFVDVSHWTPSLIPSDWSKTERYYLGEMKLRAANVRFSLSVMERGPQGVVGWLWKILKSGGSPSGTRPWFVHGRQRATFVFIDAAGVEEDFPLLLLRPDATSSAHPIVIAPDELPAKAAP